jgi:hypothetical protein
LVVAHTTRVYQSMCKYPYHKALLTTGVRLP